MSIREYEIIRDSGGECCECGAKEYLVIDEDGDLVCTDCLFEKKCGKDGANA